MDLKRNIIASYATQIYVTLVGILILPLYLKYMGAEAYGAYGRRVFCHVACEVYPCWHRPDSHVGTLSVYFRAGATDALSFSLLLRVDGVHMFELIRLIADRLDNQVLARV
jgi:hypothetical protein